MYRNRLAFLVVAFALVFVVLTGRLACMQIVNREHYEEMVERTRRRVEIHAGPRGTIRDRHGEILARDREVFDASFILPGLDPVVVVRPLVCRVAGIGEREFDERLGLAKLLGASTRESLQMLLPEITSRAARRLRYFSEKYPEKYGALRVIDKKVNGYTVSSLHAELDDLCRKERTLRLATRLLEISYSEALDKVDRVVEKTSQITNSYQRRYELYTPYALAQNISRENVEELEVKYRDYPGIIVTTRMQRVHPGGDLACHVLGYLRQINMEEYEDLKSQGRTIRRGFSELADFEKVERNPFFIDDKIGATGIERVYDDELQGRKGARLLERDTRTPEDLVLSEAAPRRGTDLFLALDAGVQRAAQDALSEAGITGAAVVMDVGTGEIITLASSPGFDLDSFRRDGETFSKHMEEPYPLLNRATSALAPGSGFKLVTAIGALAEGVITPGTHFY